MTEQKGELLKANGQARVLENNEKWAEMVYSGIVCYAKAQEPFTIEQIRRSCEGLFWDTPHPNAWGAVFSVAAKRGLIVRVGYTQNKLASAHGRVVAVWKGKS